MGCEMETLDGGGGEEERAVAGGSVKACSRAGTFHEMSSIPVTLDWYLLLAVLNFLSYVSRNCKPHLGPELYLQRSRG